jgi:hypothetical protein
MTDQEIKFDNAPLSPDVPHDSTVSEAGIDEEMGYDPDYLKKVSQSSEGRMPKEVEKETAELFAELNKKSTKQVLAGPTLVEQDVPKSELKPDGLFVMLDPWEKNAAEGTAYFTKLYSDFKTDTAFGCSKMLVLSPDGSKRPVPHAIDLWADGISHKFIIRDRYTKENVGVATICNINPMHNTGELKFVIDPAMHGKGYTRVAYRQLIEAGMNYLNLDYLLIKVIKTRREFGTTNAIMKYGREIGQMSDCVRVRGRKKPNHLCMLLFEVTRYLYDNSIKPKETK